MNLPPRLLTTNHSNRCCHFLVCKMNHRPGQDADSPLPPITERLAYLRPSRELLEFYRQKLAQFDEEHDDLVKLLEKYKSTAEDQHKLQLEVRQREGEIAELQKALSDMQAYLFQEREQALRLYAENDRLKIRELEDRKKIQHLLALVGPDAGEITYFHREPPHVVRHACGGYCQTNESHAIIGKDHILSCQFVPLSCNTADVQVEALQAQLEEQTRLSREQVESLMEDRRIHMEEARVQHQRDKDRVTAFTERLQHTQNLLYESTRDFLQLKFQSRANEKGWMAEKDRLLQQLDSCQERLRASRSGCDPPGISLPRVLRKAASAAASESQQMQLKQAHKLADMYREQCVGLETDLAQIREEGDVGREIFKERSDKIAKRLQLMTQRYEALEKRRAMEVEGFKTDIKNLRQKLKDVEKLLFKVAVNVGPDQDLAILHEVRQTNTRTKKVQGELKTLKAKIYGLENELRHC
uniref:Coiled-coil domain-containing protein 77 n=1 Tax=Denticeps clupeoides TaxID=299321 RepID=A0AAY4B0T8_9TELE